MVTLVTKADGTKQFFDKEKIMRTCLRMGATKQTAFDAADGIESRLYDGISTAKNPSMTLRSIRKQQPSVSKLRDLSKGLS